MQTTRGANESDTDLIWHLPYPYTLDNYGLQIQIWFGKENSCPFLGKLDMNMDWIW